MARTRKGNNSKAPTTVQADISESLTTNTSEQNDAPSTPTKGGMPVNAHMSTKSPRRRVTTRRASTLPGSPLHTPRKRTNERPGLIGKVTRRSKQEVAAEKATKVAKKKAAADEKMKAKERLAIMEMETAAAEGTRKKNVLRRLPSTIPDEPDSSVGEDFDWNEGMAGSSVGDGSDNDHDAGDKITTTAVQVKVK
jgi:hypothetical protein